MFAIVIHYTKPLAEVDAARGPHLEWIKEHVDDGTFLFCGRQTTGKGGVVIANAPSREALDAMLKEDGYIKAGVATHEVLEFTANSGAMLDALKAAAH